MVQVTENDIVILGMSYPDFVKTYGEEMAKKRLKQLYGTDDIKQAIEIEKKRREEYLKRLEEESKQRYSALSSTSSEKKLIVEETTGYLVGDELKTKTHTYEITVKPSGEIIFPQNVTDDVRAYIEKVVKDAAKKNINLTKIKVGSGFLSRYGEYGVVGWAEGNRVLPSGRIVFVQEMDSGKVTDMFVVDAAQKVHDLDKETKTEIIKVLSSQKIPKGSILEIRNNELIATTWQTIENQKIIESQQTNKILDDLKKSVNVQMPETYVREERITNPIRYIPLIGGMYDIFTTIKGSEPVTVKKYLTYKELIPVGTRTALSPEILIENKKVFEKLETPERIARGVIGAADVITSTLLIKTGVSYALKAMEKPLTLKMFQYSIQTKDKALVETKFFLDKKLVTEIGKATVEESTEKTALVNYQPLLRTTLEKTKLGFIRQTDEFLKDEFSKIGVKKLVEGVESRKELNLIKAEIKTPEDYLKISKFSVNQKVGKFEIGTVTSGARELETAGVYKVIKTGEADLTLITPKGLKEYQAEGLAYISRSIGRTGGTPVKIDLIGTGIRLKEVGRESENFIGFSGKNLESVVKKEASNIIVPIPEISIKNQKNILPHVTLTQTFTKTTTAPSYTTGEKTQEIIIKKPTEINLPKQRPTLITPSLNIGRMENVSNKMSNLVKIGSITNIGRIGKISDLGTVTGQNVFRHIKTPTNTETTTWTPTKTDIKIDVPTKTDIKIDIPMKITTFTTNIKTPFRIKIEKEIPKLPSLLKPNIESKRMDKHQKIAFKLSKIGSIYKPSVYAMYYNIKIPKLMKSLSMKTFFRPMRW